MTNPSPEHRILKVAKTLFTERGFSNVSMRDICQRARVTAPTVYYHFKNKEMLFEAVVRKTVTMSDFTDRLKDVCDKSGRPESQIRAFIRTYLSSFPSNLINVGLYLRHSTELDAVGTKPLMSEFERIQSVLTAIIRKGIASGEFRGTNARMAAECLLGMMHRFIFERIHFRRSYNAAEASSYLTDFFLRAMNPT